jgi:hypothetical protein
VAKRYHVECWGHARCYNVYPQMARIDEEKSDPQMTQMSADEKAILLIASSFKPPFGIRLG